MLADQTSHLTAICFVKNFLNIIFLEQLRNHFLAKVFTVIPIRKLAVNEEHLRNLAVGS